MEQSYQPYRLFHQKSPIEYRDVDTSLIGSYVKHLVPSWQHGYFVCVWGGVEPSGSGAAWRKWVTRDGALRLYTLVLLPVWSLLPELRVIGCLLLLLQSGFHQNRQ